MKYILFKSGDYGTKGNWQGDVFNKLIDNTNEIPIIPYHTSEFTERGMLKNEIPIIGKFKNISIEGDTIISSDIEIFNKIDFKHRNVDRLSIEIEDGKIKRDVLKENVAAISVGIVDRKAMLDLKYTEDSAAEVDMNVVMNNKMELIEVQGTGEESTFSRGELNAMLDFAEKGLKEIFELQDKAIEEAFL